MQHFAIYWDERNKLPFRVKVATNADPNKIFGKKPLLITDNPTLWNFKLEKEGCVRVDPFLLREFMILVNEEKATKETAL